jgi:hypothetical protein
LRADFKDRFRAAIAGAYAATGNLERARARLALLGDSDYMQVLAAQAQRMLASGASFQIARELAALATDLQAGISSVPSVTAPAPTGETGRTLEPAGAPSPLAPTSANGGSREPTSTTIVMNTPTPRPTRTPAPSPGAPFQLISKDPVCGSSVPQGLLQITILDAGGRPMPGVEVAISWTSGEDRTFTGLKPDISNGYADFVMERGLSYSLIVGRSFPPVSGLEAPACADSAGETYTGGLKLKFQQP